MAIDLSKIIESIAISVNAAKTTISAKDNFPMDLEEADVSITLETEIDQKSIEGKRTELRFDSVTKKVDRRRKPLDIKTPSTTTTTIRLIFSPK